MLGDQQGAGTVRWKRFNTMAVALIVIAALMPPVLNVVVDPYEVFGSKLVRISSTANERVLKARYLLSRHTAYDALVMGSSVTGVIPATALGDRAYNASFFSATPSDVRLMMQMLHTHGRLPRRIYIGLDPFMFTAPKTKAPQLKLPTAASGESRWSFWRDYLFAASGGAIVGKLIESAQDQPGVAFNESDGSYRLARFDLERKDNMQSYIRRRVTSAGIPSSNRWWHEAATHDLRQLVEWTDGVDGLDVVWFIPPINERARRSLGEGGERFFATIMSTVGSRVVDLSRAGVVNQDTDWYDTKHFIPQAGSRVALTLTQWGDPAAQASRPMARPVRIEQSTTAPDGDTRGSGLSRRPNVES